MPAQPSLDFRVLGPVEVWQQGRLAPVQGTKERTVLALLLLHANEFVSSDRILDEIWGGDAPETALKSLRVRVARLRGILGAERLVTRGPGYVLRVEPGELDLHRFERLVEKGRRALVKERPDTAAALLRDALSHWRGPPIADVADELLAQVSIARLEELRLVALEHRIDADLALGRHSELVGELEELTAAHPLRERLRGQLMLALYRSGRQAEALDVYRSTRRALVDELGIEPSGALQQLESAILRQDPALEHAAADAPARSLLVVPLEEERLDDLLAIAEPLARHPPRELILAGLATARDDLSRMSELVHERRGELLARGVGVRAAAFTSSTVADDAVRLAAEHDVDLLLLDGQAELLADPTFALVLDRALCDVTVLVMREEPPRPGPVLVPFAGADHDWSAVELGAWIAGGWDVPLRLAGPSADGRDASRLLARASLAVQRALGVAAEPLLVEAGADALVAAADEAELVVVGLSDRWRREGLGATRLALAQNARPPVALVRRGVRPGGLAPPESHTRFTWSIRPLSP